MNKTGIRTTFFIAAVLLAACQEADRATPITGTASSSIVTTCDEELTTLIAKQLQPGRVHEIDVALEPDEDGEFGASFDILVSDDIVVGIELALDSTTAEQWLAEGNTSVAVQFDTARLEGLITREHVMFAEEGTTLSPDALAPVLIDNGIPFCGDRRVVGGAALETSLGTIAAAVGLNRARAVDDPPKSKKCPLLAASPKCDNHDCEVSEFVGNCTRGDWFCWCI